MNPNRIHSGGIARRTSLARLLIAFLCVAGICASFLQPASARAFPKAATSFQTAVLSSHAIKSGKPCQRLVPGAVGTSCSAGPMAGLEATDSVVAEPVQSESEPAAFGVATLKMQWLGTSQFRPPRIGA